MIINVLGGEPNGPSREVARLVFPPNVLKPGWRVQISEPKGDYRSSLEKDDCGHKSRVDVGSPPFNIKIYDHNDHPITKFPKPYTISSYATVSSDKERNDLCYGFLEDEPDSKWQCTDSESDTKTSDSQYVESTLDHLTTFAVLLGDPNSLTNGGCGLDWVSIASLSMLAGALILFVFFVALFLLSERFRALVGGYNPELAMSKVMTKVDQTLKE